MNQFFSRLHAIRSNLALFRWALALMLLLAFQTSFAAVAYRGFAQAKAGPTAAVTITATNGSYGELVNCGSTNPSIPGGAVNDLLIAQVVARDDATTVSMGANWQTLFSDAVPGQDYKVYLFWRKATNNAFDTNTVTQSGTCDHLMSFITRFGNVDTTTPLQTQPLPVGNWVYGDTSTVNSGTQNVTVAGSMLVLATFGADNGNVTEDPSFTQLYERADGSGNDAAISLNTRNTATTGVFGPFTNMAWSAGTDPVHGVLFAVRPGPAVSLPTLTIARPAGTTTDDVMVASIAVADSTINIAPPAGWSVVVDSIDNTSGGNTHHVTFVKVVTNIGSEPASYVWTLSGDHPGVVGGIISFSGADTGSPVVDSGAQYQNGNSTSHITPSLNATANNMLVTAHEYQSSGTWTPPGGMAERVDVYSEASTGGGGVSLEMSHELLVAAGATGTRTAVASNDGDEGVSHALLLRPRFTTLGDGANPSNVTLGPGASITDLDAFTLQTSAGTDSVTGLTVTLTGASSFQGLSEVRITSSDGLTTYFTAVTNPASNTVVFSGGTPIPVSSTATTFKVRITPKTHANMPVPPGLSYAVGGTVTAFTSGNAQAGSDAASATVTVDNLSPTSATATGGVAGYLQNTLNWTTSASADFAPTAGSVIYRWTAASAGAEVPAEGSAPMFGAINGTATVACVVTSAGSTALSRIDGPGGSSGECTTAALTAGQPYTYKVFQKDSNGNYDVGVVPGTFTPHGVVSAATSTVVAAPGSIPADGYTTSTITVTLKDGGSIPVPGKTVTLAAGSGTSIIAPASSVTNASGVASFTVKNSTVEGPITYTATDVTDAIVITQTAQVTFTTPSLCFSDDFNRATLLGTGNWTRTKSGGTTYDAEIVGNRLRLTDSAGGRATAVHLQRLFPGAGNKVIAEFDYFAYNGSGADGVVMTLSDSSIAPVAGAFGGSLGYAQKSNPGSDCTVPGGCPGFAGGWLGIGLDEYGNFSNATEGRVDGPGFQADSISIRGSGSGLSNYNYHTRALLSPGVDSAGSATPAPGHRYRVTVDHGNGTNALVTVDRDVTGLGTSYTNVIPTYDAKAIVTQAAVPPYWLFSFTGSTGGLSNTHEIDNLTVCTAQPLVTPVLDHVRIVHDGAALTCAPETITLKACANAACDALFTGSVTTDLTNIAGATWSVDPVTFSSGQTTVTLSKATTGTVTLGGTVTAPSAMAAVCYNGATNGDCALTYSSNACAFDAVETAQNPSTPIFTKLAGTAFTVDVLALTAGVINTGYTGTVAVDLVDQTGVAPGLCGTTSLAVPTAPTSPYTFVGANNGRRSFTFNVPNAARDVRVRMVSGATTACSSDNFAIRPTSFSVTSSANNSGISGTPIVKAGANFTLDATSVNGYTGTALINSNRIQAHAGAAQIGTIGGSFSAASSGTGWISRGTNFTYSEVGSFRFAPWGVYDDGSFAGVDRSKPTPECVIDNKIGTVLDPANPNVLDGNGKYGCYFGGTVTTPYFGRFTPDHFAIAPVSVVPGCGTFTYFGQDGFATAFTLTAQNSSNATTANYVGIGNAASWAKLPLTVWGAAPATAGSPGFGFAVSTWAPSQPAGAAIAASATPPSATNGNTWLAGTTTVTARHLITRPTAPAAPTTTTVSALPVDSDGVTLVAATAIGMPMQRYGRLRLLNAYGSELLRPRVEYRTEYWDGSRWTSNTLDACTVIASGNVAASGLTVNAITPTNAGVGFISFNPVAVGAYDIALNLNASGDDTSCNVSHPPGSTAANKPWLQGFWSSPANCGGTAAWAQDPNARIKLGSPKAPYIYLRERY